MKKCLSVLLALVFVLGGVPVQAYAQAPEALGIVVSDVTSNSAKYIVQKTVPNGRYTVYLGDQEVSKQESGQFRNLKEGTTYDVKVVETSTVEETKVFPVVYKNKGDNKWEFYYMDGEKKVNVNPNETEGDRFIHDGFWDDYTIFWKSKDNLWVPYYRYIWHRVATVSNTPERFITAKTTREIRNEATTTFKTTELYTIGLEVQTGGIAIVDGKTYTPGTHVLGQFAENTSISGKSYANAGYVGGKSFTIEANGDKTEVIAFEKVADTYGMATYVTDGYFSGLKAAGADISQHDPKNDVLAATLSASLKEDKTYGLGDAVKINLSINVLDGDANTKNLNEVNIKSDVFNKDLGTVNSTKTLEVDYTLPTDINAYTRIGETDEYEKTIAFDFIDRYDGNDGAAILSSAVVTIKIHYVKPIEKVTVTLDYADGVTAQKTVEVEKSTKYVLSETPSRDGYTFEGWTFDGSVVTDVTPDTDITVVATWKVEPVVVEKVKVTFDYADGVSAQNTVEVEKSTKYVLSETPSRDGYTFEGWTFDGSVVTYVTPDTDITVVATWKEIPVVAEKVIVTLDYADGVTAQKTVEVEKSTKYVLSETPSRDGYTFEGWTFDGSVVTDVTPDTDITVVATWKEIEQIVKYELNVIVIGEGTVNPNGGQYEEGKTLNLSAVPNAGWRVKGWSGDTTDGSVTMNGDKSVTVEFERIPVEEDTVNLTVEITGSGTVTPNGGTYDIGEVVQLTATPLDGWVFKGWGGDTVDGTVTMDTHKNVTALFERVDTPVDPPVAPPIVPPTPITPDPVPVGPQGTVVVEYIDQNGASLAPSFSFTGEVGTAYGTSSRSFGGYTLESAPSNASGTFTSDTITVTYQYNDGSVVVETEETPLGSVDQPTEEPVVEEPIAEETIVEEPVLESKETETEVGEDVTIELNDEKTPEGAALPQTGQYPMLLYFGLGGLTMLSGFKLRGKKQS